MTRPLTDRNAEIVSLHDSGSTDAEIAAVYGIAPHRVGQIVRAATERRRPGRRRTDAITPASHRGRALLARLVADAATAGVEPEAYLDSAQIVSRAVNHAPRGKE